MDPSKAQSIATEYAEDIVLFVMRENGNYRWRPQQSSGFTVHKAAFKLNVGKAIINMANRTEARGTIAKVGEFALNTYTTYEQFEIFAGHYADDFFIKFGCYKTAIFELFAHIIGFSILYHKMKPHMESAPDVAVRVIADILFRTNDRSFVQTGGLDYLNQTAKDILYGMEKMFLN